MPLRQRMGDSALFSSQRLVDGRGLAQQEGRGPNASSRPPSGRQNRSRSIGHLEFLPVPPPSLTSSLSHPSIGPTAPQPPTLSFSPPPSSSPSSSSYAEGTAHFSALLLRSSYFHSVEAASGLPSAGGAAASRRQRCRSGSHGYFFLLHVLCFCKKNKTDELTRQEKSKTAGLIFDLMCYFLLKY